MKLFVSKRMEGAFWAKVKVGNHDECWPWTGYCSPEGYGRFYDCGVRLVASRVAWEIANKEALGNRLACHHCDNPQCCNPDHIYAGDEKTNAHDASQRGLLRNGRQEGESHKSAKLTAQDVKEIRKRYAEGETAYSIAEDFPVAHPTIYKVCLGKTWKHV